MSFYSRTLNGTDPAQQYPGKICIWLFRRTPGGSNILFGGGAQAASWTYSSGGNWPADYGTAADELPIAITATTDLGKQKVNPNSRLGLAISVAPDVTPYALELMYDHPLFPSRLDVDTTTPLTRPPSGESLAASSLSSSGAVATPIEQMMAAAASLAFLGGICAGSFVSVVAHRVPRRLSIVGPRSQCPSCGAQIAAYDNIPVISWLLLRGRCRSCAAPISVRYPAVELSVGVAFVATVLVLWDQPAQLALGLVFVATLAAITLTDLEQRIIPNRILLVSALIGVAIAAAVDPGSLPERALAALAAGGLLLLTALVYPKGDGYGRRQARRPHGPLSG